MKARFIKVGDLVRFKDPNTPGVFLVAEDHDNTWYKLVNGPVDASGKDTLHPWTELEVVWGQQYQKHYEVINESR